ncbi:MAG: sugar transferase [Deltaproteobacteria bacterium]|nr:sugar transferase [Deltaproteobacteria bacterium]
MSSHFDVEGTLNLHSNHPIRFFSNPAFPGFLTALLLLAFDILGFGLSFLWASAWHGPISWGVLLSAQFALMTGIGLVLLYVFDLYKPTHHISGLYSPGRVLITVAAMVIANLVARSVFQNVFEFALNVHAQAIFYGFLSFWLIISRMAFSGVLRRAAKRQSIVFLLDKASMTELGRELSEIKSANICILFDPKQEVDDKIKKLGLKINGTWDDLQRHTKKPDVTVVVGMKRKVPDQIRKNLLNLRFHGHKLYDMIHFYQRSFLKLPIFYFQNYWFDLTKDYFDYNHMAFNWRLKKLMDYFFAFVLLILISPIMLLIALCIKLESRGPVFFVQSRFGQNEEVFNLYKFRTMRVGSEKGNPYTQKNDDRITRVGKVLRKLRLDELPQLWNVLKGDMSMIGPRAEWDALVDKYEKVIPFYHFRHVVKPGITGWAQVLYPYGASVEDSKEKLQYDLYYIKNYSLLLDFAIVIKTIKVMLFGRGR